MANYKADKTFKGKKENKVFKAGVPFEMTAERVEEVQKNIKEEYDIDIKFELIETPKDDEFNREEAKNKLKELGVEFNGNAKNEDLKQLLEDQEGGE